MDSDHPGGTAAREALARPLTLPCGLTLKNRLAKAAMTEGLADPQGRPTDAHERLYGAWADGGLGLAVTGNVMVDPDHLERPGNVVLSGTPDAETRRRLEAWARAATRQGGHLWMQLSHSGRQTQKKVNPRPKAPSAVALGLPGGQFTTPEPLTDAEIEALIQRFADAAATAQETGFTGVQIHAAHGYLLSQFLSPRVNQRTDQWGGSLENRARLLRWIVAAVRARCGPRFALSVKLNSADFQRGGFSADDSLQVARWLAADGIDLLEVSGGTYEQPKMLQLAGIEAEEPPKRQSTKEREAFFLDVAAHMRAQLDMPLMVTGGFRSAIGMAQALSDDGIDLIGLGRPLTVDPAAPGKLLSGAIDGLEKWEDRLGNPRGRIGINAGSTMLRAAAGFGVMAWYYAQLDQIGRGRPVQPGLSIWRALWRLQMGEARWLKQWQQARRRGGL